MRACSHQCSGPLPAAREISASEMNPSASCGFRPPLLQMTGRQSPIEWALRALGEVGSRVTGTLTMTQAAAAQRQSAHGRRRAQLLLHTPRTFRAPLTWLASAGTPPRPSTTFSN